MSTATNPTIEVKRSLDALNSLLRGEHAAVETYEQAIAKFGIEVPDGLAVCLQSHQNRVRQLTVRIYDLGGKPAESSGMWGAFAKLVEGGATLFGRGAALAALEEGEDRGLAQYRDRFEDLDAESRQLIEGELLPEQLHTHDTLRNLLRITP